MSQLRTCLQKRGSQLVLTYTNVSELVAPLCINGEFLQMRTLLQSLEALPVVYLREIHIPIQELLSTASAFEPRQTYTCVDPYVRRWDETFQPPSESAAEMYVNFRLDEIVYTLWKSNPGIFIKPKKHGDGLRKILAENRALPKTKRKSYRKNFINKVIGTFAQRFIPLPTLDMVAFSEWIYSKPKRCPGLCLNYETFHEMVANIRHEPKDSAIFDFAHLYAVPYVDAITLDGTMIHYCRAAITKLQKLDSAINYDEHLYPNLERLLQETS